ncbi:putative glutamate-1-semialdehyde 2,1-aminomutase [Dactylonectria macrodidyma]|uniref:Glutamate-1-semialdehyde 2,1-aminomutase n=1 Tax=Dactylonectria macrodidyma TaxID=307937 RepID=A0A9P9IQ94_9HYPO|nr:putative glutamate-1-semialdehyde 2,1-aminomutase [Dactylonectria macrodidyma]
MDCLKNEPHAEVIQDVKNYPTLVRYGAGVFSEFIGSDPESTVPIMLGIWKADDIQDNEVVFEASQDEVKYIISGESTWKIAQTEQEFHVGPGSVLWLPKGSRTIRVRSKGLTAFYVEQGARLPTTLQEANVSWVPKLDALYNRVLKDFIQQNPKSQDRFNAATKVMPGGNTRSVLHYDPFPLALISGRSCYVTSADGAEYLDCVSEYSAAMFGHSNPNILEAIQKAMSRGINLGGPGNDEVLLAQSIKDRFHSIDTVRFCNSGTEANTMALALATHVTQKHKILAFENGYHGGSIQFDSKPLATTIPHDFILGRFNDIEYTKSLLSDEIGAIIVEPMQGAGGVTVGTKEFLQFLRNAAMKYKALLIFDEVVTSRLHINGLQGHFNIFPDITTLGKYIGGGPSFGAFGGRAEVMEALDPRHPSPIHHSGTYNNNIFTMAAGVAAAKILTQDKIKKANSLGDKLRDGINSTMKTYSVQLIGANGMGSMIGIRFNGPDQTRLRDCFFLYMLSRGIYLGKRGFVALNLVHEEQHIDQLLDSFSAFMEEVFGECKWMN